MSNVIIDSKYKFLEELSELTKKYNISVEGCGCCGSPFLVYLGNKTIIGECISWDENNKVYEMENDF